MRLHISYKIYSTSWSYWSIRVLTVIIFPVPALPTEVYLRFELGWHLGYAGGTRESTGPEFPHHHRPLQKCKNTNTTVGLVGKKKRAADEVLPDFQNKLQGSTNSVELPTIQFCYAPTLFPHEEEKSKGPDCSISGLFTACNLEGNDIFCQSYF